MLSLGDITKDYIIQNCGNNTKNTKNNYVIDGNSEKSGLCRVIIPKKVDGKSYRVSSLLQNTIGPRGINSGTLGFAYNVKDEFNFDFVYLR